MIFNSITYILFFLIVVILYWTLPTRLRLIMIFFASMIFYAFWKVEFVLLMLISTLNDFWMSKFIYKSNQISKRRLFLVVSLVVNLGLLFYFKYLYFFSDNINILSQVLGIKFAVPLYEIILPLGISFYTFQTISYTVDVYRNHIKPEQDFITYGCYVMFFPQLVAGPILRAAEVIYQLKNRVKFNIKHIGSGVERILYGLFLKTVLADNIAPLVDKGFLINASELSAIDVWTLSFLFGFQIYFDFSAYSHIAIGSARCMGIQFPENFNFPYAASSFKEFWKRWHISLSSWIRDYLYLPLMGLKVLDRSTGGINIATKNNQKKNNFSLFLTWAIMGLWHGANWTFVFWGLYHSLLIYIERIMIRIKINVIPPNIKKLLGLFITLPLVMLSWIPFRAQNLNDTFLMLGKIISIKHYSYLGMRENIYLIAFLILLLFFCSYLYNEYIKPSLNVYPILYITKDIVKFSVLITMCFIFLRPIRQFIYFQF